MIDKQERELLTFTERRTAPGTFYMTLYMLRPLFR